MNAPARINGHPSAAALEQLRADRETLARSLTISLQYLRFAQQTNHLYGLGFDLPSDKGLAEALDTVERSLR